MVGQIEDTLMFSSSRGRSESSIDSSPAWKVPTLDLLSFIKEGSIPDTELSSGEKVSVSDLKYTILDNKQVVFRDVHELAELCIATGDIPRNLVAFRPERLALHEIIKAVITRLQYIPETAEERLSLEYDHIFLRIAKGLIVEFKSEINLASFELYEQHKVIEALVTRLVLEEEFKADKLLQDDHVQSCIEAIQSEKKKVNDVELGKHVPGYTIQKAIIALATDAVFTKLAQAKMEALINQLISALIEGGKLTALDIPPASQRLLLLVAGGQASGKGSSVAQLKYSAQQAGIEWSNISKGGGDIFRSLLLDHGAVPPNLYQQMCQDEASLVSHNKVFTALDKMAEQGKAPHVFIEQIYVGKEKIEMALKEGGTAYIVVVSTEVNDAVERAFLRGIDTGRFETVRGILTAHKGMAVQLPDRLSECADKSVFIRIVDNNVSKGEQPIKVADIDCINKTIQVYDKQKLERFISKTAINIYATHPDDVYNKTLMAQVSIDKYFNAASQYVIQYKELGSEQRQSPGSL